MQRIDERRLETDPEYRYRYVAEFIGFGPEDVTAIRAVGPLLGPLVPSLVERTYEKLLAFDATARHFVPHQTGFEGRDAASLNDLRPDSAPIRFRKDHLTRYLLQLLGRNYDGKMVQYLDMVGKMHTRSAGNQAIHVPLVQMNALIGLLSDMLTETLASLPIEPLAAVRAIRAFNKVLWMQNDFVTRHYAETRE